MAVVANMAVLGVPLFPTFAPIAHYIVDTDRSAADLRTTALFGLASLVPYAVYLVMGSRRDWHCLRRWVSHLVDGADHAFHVLARSGRTDRQVMDEVADTIVAWMLAA